VVLVDSSVWIALLRDQRGARPDALRDLIHADAAALAPPIYQEVLQGARTPKHFGVLRDYFSTLPFLVSTHPVRTHEAAADLYARCRWAGVTPRNGYDCLIGAIAIEHDVDLLVDDRDFHAIVRVEPRLRLYKTART
jgi:predicted nucleic acid-binding protein